MNIVVLDADPPSAALIASTLTGVGHTCHTFTSMSAIQHYLDLQTQLDQTLPCILLLDLDTEGSKLDTFLQWRQQTLQSPHAAPLPVLFLARCAEQTVLDRAMAQGGADYQLKPLRRAELLARVARLIRITYPEQMQTPPLSFGEFAFETQRSLISRRGLALPVTRKEFALALLLFRHLGQPLSRATIVEAVWGHQQDLPSRTMDTHISRVRNKLGLVPEQGFRLLPVYSYGYQLEQIDR